MAALNKIAEKAAGELGLNFGTNHQVAFGQYQGFTMLIMPMYKEKNIRLLFCASKGGYEADRAVVESEGLEDGVSYETKGLCHSFFIKAARKDSDTVSRIVRTAEKAVSALINAGFTNCSENGAEDYTDIYFENETYRFYTNAEADSKRSELSEKKDEYDSIIENKPLGTIGAIIGSLIGVILIILIGRLRRVSVLSGLVMGLGCIGCYKWLGKKLSFYGAVVCTVISLIMSYLSFRTDAAIDLFNAFKGTEYAGEFPFSFCFRYAKELFEAADELGTYYMNLFMIMLGGAGGSAVMIWTDRYHTKRSFVLTKLGE